MTREELYKEIVNKKSFLCVGLDSDINKIPRFLIDKYGKTEGIFQFNKEIIKATTSYCIAYKPNLAFYEILGSEGIIAFEKTITFLKNSYPNHLIIADAKRGDIGNTSEAYASSFFDELDVDALTVAPYMGEDSIAPMLKWQNKWTILLALTSNKGSKDFQMQKLENGRFLFEEVLETSKKWGNENQIMYVVGATQTEMLQRIRKIIPNHFLLVPGVGSQNGSLEDVAKYGMIKDCGLIVNASRSIIYASSDSDFAEKARIESEKLQQEMAKYL